MNCVRFTPDGKSYTSAGDDGTIRFWTFTEEAVEADAPPTADAEHVAAPAAKAADEAHPPADVDVADP